MARPGSMPRMRRSIAFSPLPLGEGAGVRALGIAPRTGNVDSRFQLPNHTPNALTPGPSPRGRGDRAILPPNRPVWAIFQRDVQFAAPFANLIAQREVLRLPRLGAQLA